MKKQNRCMGRFGALLGNTLFVMLHTIGCEADEPYPPPISEQPTTGGGHTTSEEPSSLKEPVLPPVSGGTLLITDGGMRAVASDPDVDVIWTARLDAGVREHVIELQKGDEPGRLVESSDGKVHVALRGAGEIATIDPAVGELIRRTAVCQMARGLEYDAASDQVAVGCAEGKIVVINAQSGAITKSLSVEPDIRDVFFLGDQFVVTTLRSAELISFDGNGHEIDRAKPPPLLRFDGTAERWFSPAVAWRTIRMPDGTFLMVHQGERSEVIDLESQQDYGSHCSGIMYTGFTRFVPTEGGQIDDPLPGTYTIGEALPVDLLIYDAGKELAVAAAGGRTIIRHLVANLSDPGFFCDALGAESNGMPVGLGESNGEIIVLLRDPPFIAAVNSNLRIDLGLPATNAGHALFHSAPNGVLACASCHPEGREDGHVWNFSTMGARRSQSLRGGVQATLPLNWDGGMADIHAIVADVFVKRLGGSPPTADEEKSLVDWINALPRLTPLRNPQDDAALRGKKIFESAEAGCNTCHSGEHFTNNQNEDVGLGGALQVPSLLGVAWRTPLMHSGCAKTLADRFDPNCGGANHGHTDQLSAHELADLIAYLESL
ncbi:MAG: c-type cytochrome [Polyangiaceae bacterium]|nr:c-type cytochrome [Polyangiaceae bacterium]